ncbi:hypothetical protein ASE04_10940 [Rhizobium sp. Root708]|nr:hypothetical protein ASE04_10940 [Rhizobium sp. Root708]
MVKSLLEYPGSVAAAIEAVENDEKPRRSLPLADDRMGEINQDEWENLMQILEPAHAACGLSDISPLRKREPE